MQEQIVHLIEQSYGKQAAREAASFSPDEAARNDLLNSGIYVLQAFPKRPGACAVMTAMWLAVLRDSKGYPAHAVAGSLSIDGHPVFGASMEDSDYQSGYKETNLDWDGHAWIVLGDLIGDVSLFRTAYATGSPAVLTNKVLSEFGEGKGLFIVPSADAESLGFQYQAKHIITDDEITALVRGAAYVIEPATGQKRPPKN